MQVDMTNTIYYRYGFYHFHTYIIIKYQMRMVKLTNVYALPGKPLYKQQ